MAPGAETIRELFADRPALILLDELSVYLRKVSAMAHGRDQLTAFLTSLFKAVESAPNVALVYTLAIGKGGLATDAYARENQFIAERMAAAESVSARKATLLNPTEDDETAKVLRRRLFAKIDDAKASAVVAPTAPSGPPSARPCPASCSSPKPPRRFAPPTPSTPTCSTR